MAIEIGTQVKLIGGRYNNAVGTVTAQGRPLMGESTYRVSYTTKTLDTLQPMTDSAYVGESELEVIAPDVPPAQEQSIRDEHVQELTKAAAILHSTQSPALGRDTAADQIVRSTDRYLAKLEQRAIHTHPNGVSLIGVYDRGVLVNEYHGVI